MWLARDDMRVGGGYSLWRIKPTKSARGKWQSRPYHNGYSMFTYEDRIADNLSTMGIRAMSSLDPGTCVKVRGVKYGRVYDH